MQSITYNSLCVYRVMNIEKFPLPSVSSIQFTLNWSNLKLKTVSKRIFYNHAGEKIIHDENKSFFPFPSTYNFLNSFICRKIVYHLIQLTMLWPQERISCFFYAKYTLYLLSIALIWILLNRLTQKVFICLNTMWAVQSLIILYRALVWAVCEKKCWLASIFF